MIMKTGFFQVSNLVKVQVEQFGRAAILSVEQPLDLGNSS